MEYFEYKLPYADAVILIDVLRFYAKYIDGLGAADVSEDEYADLQNDGMRVKALERQIKSAFGDALAEY